MTAAICSVPDCDGRVHARDYCPSHYAKLVRRNPLRPVPPTPNDRFHAKVRVNGTCWEWVGYVLPNGYAQFNVGGRHVYAHRYAYEMTHGQIPQGLTIDHLCRNRRCVNPAHLEAVSAYTNLMRGNAPTAINKRKTHCIHGHEFTPENTRTVKGNRRQCRTCESRQRAVAEARRKESRR